MNIIRYQALLNSGVAITESSAAGTALSWDSLHWSNTLNCIKRNRVIMEETEKGILVCADIAMELQSFTETMCFTERNPIVIELEAKADSVILAYYYFKDWWTRPAFLSSFEEVPDETAILFYQGEGEYHFLLALPGRVFRAHFEGRKGCRNLRLILSADASGYTGCCETAMLAVSDTDPWRCMEKGMRYAAELYHMPLREERKFPPLFEKIGWCSWDAFYKDVSEEGLIEKAAEIRDKKLPFGWMIIDDGWQDYKNERMVSYGSNDVKFPDGLRGAVDHIREICGIDQIGVWHAFSGYWGGIDPEGKLAAEHPERFFTTHQGKMMIKPDEENAYAFFSDWYYYLKSQGISFAKVDSQSSTRQHYRTNTPIGQTSAALHNGLDRAVSDYMDEKLINCMGMAMEDVLARPSSGVSRNSDDFFPMEEESFKEHLLENAYNTIWHNVIYYCDWDMFWSMHPYAQKHALLRALSAGPVYLSDRVGETRREILMPLCYEDGTILRAQKGALPTADCLLKNPAEVGYLKIGNICYGLGYLAVYSYKDEEQTVEMKISELTALASAFSAAESGLCQADRLAVFDVFGESGFTADAETGWTCTLKGSGCVFYQVAPVMNGIAVFGRKDKYLSSQAICSRQDFEAGCMIHLHEMGPVLIYADRMPTCTVDGSPVLTVQLASEGFWKIDLPVKEQRAEIEIRI